jgi:Cu/Ag efflux protein CusF
MFVFPSARSSRALPLRLAVAGLQRSEARHLACASALLIAGLWAAPSAHAADGEIRKIDAAQAKVTIKSGPMPKLDLPAMTLVFKANPATLLGGLSEGDLVSFEAEKIGGQYTLTSIKKR